MRIAPGREKDLDVWPVSKILTCFFSHHALRPGAAGLVFQKERVYDTQKFDFSLTT